ncbi:hypothetical protein CcI6DRAFT_01205 [Frankia sp. CcI6]|nr:hypothetical protein CcI6DRAFT_01205 [Frankia sp. CcI6]KDA43567.1 hypothetical protein BMG523Draft_01472 [Frankia sp. BMG5.23]OAA25788.1 hypothetical protein AAY23_10368 [Frankia casuarinae]
MVGVDAVLRPPQEHPGMWDAVDLAQIGSHGTAS